MVIVLFALQPNLLPLPAKCWDYRQVPLYPARSGHFNHLNNLGSFLVLGMSQSRCVGLGVRFSFSLMCAGCSSVNGKGWYIVELQGHRELQLQCSLNSYCQHQEQKGKGRSLSCKHRTSILGPHGYLMFKDLLGRPLGANIVVLAKIQDSDISKDTQLDYKRKKAQNNLEFI